MTVLLVSIELIYPQEGQSVITYNTLYRVHSTRAVINQFSGPYSLNYTAH